MTRARQAGQYAEEVGLRVVGYYQASERLDDTSLVPVGEKVVGRIKAGFAEAVAFVVCGFFVCSLLWEG